MKHTILLEKEDIVTSTIGRNFEIETQSNMSIILQKEAAEELLQDLQSFVENNNAFVHPIKFARWLLKFATPAWEGDFLCWEYEGRKYDTDELYSLYEERTPQQYPPVFPSNRVEHGVSLEDLKKNNQPELLQENMVSGAKPELGLYDRRNGNSVMAYKMFDATKLCCISKRCVIKYAVVVRGRIAQINDWYEADRDLGLSLHYHINEMSVEEMANDEVFVRQCVMMGVRPLDLAQAIFDNQ